MKVRSSVTAVIYAVILLIFLGTAALATEIPSPASEFYIYDGANVIDKTAESYIIERNKKLENVTGAQIVIVTVDSTGDKTIKDFASEIFTRWKIGDAEKKNGLLILLAIDDENYWVAQGSGIEDRLTTANIKTILDSFLEPYFAQENYSKGVQTVFDKFISSFESIYSVDIDTVVVDDTTLAKTDGGAVKSVLKVVAIIAGIVVFVVIVVVVVKKLNFGDRYKSRKAPSRRVTGPRPAARVTSYQGSRPRNGGTTGGRTPARRPGGSPRPNGQRPTGNSRPHSPNRNGAPHNRNGQR